jgi:pilus assembly protein CpaB
MPPGVPEMKPKTVVLLAIAVGSGLLAMIGVQQAMSGSSAQPEETVKVAVALLDIDIGAPLSEENVGFRDVPKSVLVGMNDPVQTVEHYAERSPLLPYKTGDILRISKLSEPGGGGKSLQIPKGMRVLTITVDETGSQSGLLRPGDRVDVMVTYSSRESNGRQNTKTTTLLEYVEVFSCNDKTAAEAKASANEKQSSTSTIGLLLSPENVPYLKLAESKGKLGLAWRRRDDDEMAAVGPINEKLLDELRGLEPSAGRPGYDLAPPLYGDGAETGFASPPTGNFGGIGSPDVAAAPVPAPAAGAGGMQAMLAQAEAAPVAAAPVAVPAPVAAPAPPPKPTWKIQIYSGSQPVNQEFELPESEQPQAEEQPAEETAKGGQLWNLFKTAL